MKITFTTSFLKSLKTLSRQQTWWYKTYYFFKSDLPRFFKNIYLFRKELLNHEWWDYRFTLNMLERSIKIVQHGIEKKGQEVSESRYPKIVAMKRAIRLLENNRDCNYIERAEKELGEILEYDWEFEETINGSLKLIDKETEDEKNHSRKVFKRAKEIENQEWEELWEIFKGTENSKNFGDRYDGTDMRGWWD